MQIAYFSLDEVNRFMVRQWAKRHDVRIALPSVATIGQATTAGTVVDFDFVPEPLRGEWLRQALTGAFEGPVLVHGHGLSDREARMLSRRGMTVCKGCLRRRVFRECRNDSEGCHQSRKGRKKKASHKGPRVLDRAMRGICEATTIATTCCCS